MNLTCSGKSFGRFIQHRSSAQLTRWRRTDQPFYFTLSVLGSCHPSTTYGIRLKEVIPCVCVRMDFARWALPAIPPLRLTGRFYAQYHIELRLPNNSGRGWADSSQLIGCVRRAVNSTADHGFDISKNLLALLGRLPPSHSSILVMTASGWGFYAPAPTSWGRHRISFRSNMRQHSHFADSYLYFHSFIGGCLSVIFFPTEDAH